MYFNHTGPPCIYPRTSRWDEGWTLVQYIPFLVVLPLERVSLFANTAHINKFFPCSSCYNLFTLNGDFSFMKSKKLQWITSVLRSCNNQVGKTWLIPCFAKTLHKMWAFILCYVETVRHYMVIFFLLYFNTGCKCGHLVLVNDQQ